jgi:hypothetical protein
VCRIGRSVPMKQLDRVEHFQEKDHEFLHLYKIDRLRNTKERITMNIPRNNTMEIPRNNTMEIPLNIPQDITMDIPMNRLRNLPTSPILNPVNLYTINRIPNTMLPQTERSIQLLETSNYFIRIYELYQETHIVPTEIDFLYQINNHDPMYLIFYWLNLESHYPQFVEEEMDLETIRWMEEPDFVYFNITSELFKQFVRSLNL